MDRKQGKIVQINDTNLTPLRLGKKYFMRMYRVRGGKAVMESDECLWEMSQPMGATLLSRYSLGGKTKSPPMRTAKPNVKLSSILSLFTITWKKRAHIS